MNSHPSPRRGRAAGTSTLALALAIGLAAPAAFAATQPSESGGNVSVANTPAVTADVNVTDAMLNDPGAANWTNSGHGYTNQRFSTLNEINSGNVTQMIPVAIAQTGFTASFETTPVVVNGVMYITTPMVNSKQAMIAMDAATGREMWRYVHDDGLNHICCGPVNRGVVAAYGKVFFVTIDDHLIALDAKTGKADWSTVVADAKIGYSETAAPQAYDGMVIIGSAGGEWATRGFIAAYNAADGKQVWRFDTTKDDAKSWAGDSWKYGGGGVWTTPAIDPKLGLVIFSVGNPNPDLNGSVREGNNLYTDSMVALNAKTGAFAWAYQEVPHDVWDYDATSNVILFDAEDNGKMVPAAGEAGKTAWYYIVNRETGQLIRKSEPFDEHKNMFAQPTVAGVQSLPGANGGSEWSPPAYSPLTQFVYVLGMNQLMTFKTETTTPLIPGLIRLGSTFANVPGGLQNGTLSAIDVNTGKIAWNQTVPQPMMGGALATAGNLVFTGEGDGWFDAFDAKSGKLLWRFNLGAGVNAPPVAYQVNGHEYIAVAAGGNFQMSYPLGDTLAIFTLPH